MGAPLRDALSAISFFERMPLLSLSLFHEALRYLLCNNLDETSFLNASFNLAG
jgi:hypothetical protein